MITCTSTTTLEWERPFTNLGEVSYAQSQLQYVANVGDRRYGDAERSLVTYHCRRPSTS